MKIGKPSGLALMLLLASPLTAAQETVLYDDFKSKTIDPQKWEGGLLRFGAAEVSRRIDGSGLRLDLRGYADTSKDSGSKSVRNSLYLPEDIAAKVSTIEVEAAVKEAFVQGCKANPRSSKARFRLVGYWFGDGSATKSRDRTGNVWAQIWIRGKEQTPTLASSKLPKTKSLDVTANVYRCSNADCTRGKNVFNQKLDTAKAGEKKKLSITWNELSNEFVFKSDKEVAKYDYSTDLVNAGAPNYGYFKGVQAATNVEECDMSNRRKWHRPSAHISAKIDDVRLNADYKRDW